MDGFLLGAKWLEELVDRLDDEGWTAEQISDYANAWSSCVVRYACYLTEEGYSAKETARLINAAVDKVDFDLSQMPVVPGD
jgi:hypothetical protein